MVLTPDDHPDAFAQAACRLHYDPARRDALARAGQTLYRSTFDWPILAARLAERLEVHTAA